jgi:hypothetical protein
VTARARLLVAAALLAAPHALGAQDAPLRFDRGRFTVVSFPRDSLLARSLLERATARDTFPGLPRPTQRVLIAIAPDRARFRQWIGPNAPEWGAAIAFPLSRRIVMQGRSAGSDAGDPEVVIRHELAHLALHEFLDDLPPRWFDEGYASYAAGEWGRDDVLATNVALLVRGMPPLDSLDDYFEGGARRADAAYAFAYRAVAELAALDPDRGLTLFFRYWRETGSMDRAVRAAYGLTLSGFEREWQSRTRRRYGALALAGDLALGGIVFLVILLPLYLARRRRDRRRMALLVAADEATARADSRVIEELLRDLPPAAGGARGTPGAGEPGTP